MRELGRMAGSRAIVLGLAAILILNGALFYREQIKNGLGMEVTMPQTRFTFVLGSLVDDRETVDAGKAYEKYTQLIDRLRSRPAEDILTYLQGEKDRLEKLITDTEADATESDKLTYAAVSTLLPRAEYLAGYADWLRGIQENREEMLSFSIFNDPNSFAGRNIVRTAGEFQKLEGVELTLMPDGAFSSALTFRLTDYLLLAALLMTALTFLEERKAGLWSVVRAAPGGRLKLAVRRVAIMLLFSVVLPTLLYGTDLAIGLTLYGGAGELGNSVQSVELLGRLPELWTVGGFLVRFLALRAGAAFFTGLLLWALLSAVNDVKYALVAAALALAAEYGLYAWLPVQSVFNILKYFNIFTYISLSDLYVSYLNIDVFGFPLGIRRISQLALPVLCIASAALCGAVQCRKMPAGGRDILGRAAYAVSSVTDRLLGRLGPLGLELYKQLWLQKGIIIALLALYAAADLTYAVPVPAGTPEAAASREYTRELSGLITQETLDRIDAIQAELDAVAAEHETALQQYQSGEMEYPQYDVYRRRASEAETKSRGLAPVRARVEELMSQSEEQNFTPWLTEETGLEAVYGPNAQRARQTAASLAVLTLTLMLSGLGAYERRSGMRGLLRASPRGRGSLAVRKICVTVLTALFVWCAVYIRELPELLRRFPRESLAASVRNIELLDEFPISCSVGAWLVLLSLWRVLALAMLGAVTVGVSGLFKRPETACIACVCLTLIPSLLSVYLGVDALRPVSCVLPVSGWPVVP